MIIFEKHPIFNDFALYMKELDVRVVSDHGCWVDDDREVTWTGISLEIEHDDGSIVWIELPNNFLNLKFCTMVNGGNCITVSKTFSEEHRNSFTIYSDGLIIFRHTTLINLGYDTYHQAHYNPASGMRINANGSHIPASQNILNIYKEIINFILKCHKLSCGVTQG